MTSGSLKALSAETGAVLLQSFRTPEFLIPTLALPVSFYLFFGVLMAGSAQATAYLLATYGVFAVMGPGIFGFGVNVASERERGWLDMRRVAPTGAGVFIGAKLIATLVFAAMALMPVYAAAAFLGGVALERDRWCMLLTLHLSAVIPFALIGLSIGFSVSSSGAVAIANIVFLGLAVLGGLWFPATYFPDWMQAISNALPSYHLAELALSVSGADGERSPVLHLGYAAAITSVLAVLAARSWQRQRR